MHNKRLLGKVAVITGGSSAIGLATARLFVEEGAFVFITGRRQDQLDLAIKEIGTNSSIGIQGDVSNSEDFDRLIEAIKTKKGKLDIFFANAGIAEPAMFGEITSDQINNQFNVFNNLRVH